jgi:hypothetical protein
MPGSQANACWRFGCPLPKGVERLGKNNFCDINRITVSFADLPREGALDETAPPRSSTKAVRMAKLVKVDVQVH